MSSPVTFTTESVVSNYFANLLLQQHLVKAGSWLALHVADPTDLGLVGTELVGGDYLRQRLLFHPSGAKAVGSSNSQRFTGLPACRLTHLAAWDRQAGGNYLFKIELAEPIPVSLNGYFLAAAGDVAFSL